MTLEEEMNTIKERRHCIVTLLSNGHYGVFTSSFKPVMIAEPSKIGSAIIRAHQDDILERIGRPLAEVLVEMPPPPVRKAPQGAKPKRRLVSPDLTHAGRDSASPSPVGDPTKLGL